MIAWTCDVCSLPVSTKDAVTVKLCTDCARGEVARLREALLTAKDCGIVLKSISGHFVDEQAGRPWTGRTANDRLMEMSHRIVDVCDAALRPKGGDAPSPTEHAP